MADIERIAEEFRRQLGDDLASRVTLSVRRRTDCTCTPCTTPARGAPGIEHCAACCSGSLIESYDHDCPVIEHQEMAIAQFGITTEDQ